MKASLLVACCVVLGIIVACGKPPKACDADVLMDKAQLCTTRDSIGFGLEFGSGTYIGTSTPDSFTLKNGGMADLNVASVTVSGDSAFKYTASWDDNLTDTTIPAVAVKGNKTVFVKVEFAPTAPQRYTGSLTIASNAENTPSKTLQVSGCGVPADAREPDGGLRMCLLADAGLSDALCRDSRQRCHPRRGSCVGVSPCYYDGGFPP